MSKENLVTGILRATVNKPEPELPEMPEKLRVIPLPAADSGNNQSILRISNQWIDRKKENPTKFFRREPVIVTNRDTGMSVLLYVRGASNDEYQKRISSHSVAMDYDAIDALGLPYFNNSDQPLSIRRATELEKYKLFWSHPDLGIQLSIRLGLAGAVLGVMGFVVGVTSFFL